MIKIQEKPIVFVDVDDSLVIWDSRHVPEEEIDNYLNLSNGSVMVWPHMKHIEMIKHFKARGHTVVVWSQGGADWAETIVNKLELNRWVDVVMPKPTWFIDDLPSSLFMSEGNRIWLDPKVSKKDRISPRNFNPLDDFS